MKNGQIRILDGHVHAFGKKTRSIRDLLAFEKSFGYDVCNYLSCECMGDATQNALGIYLKLIAPQCYAYGGLTYRCAYDPREELDQLMEIGFDGMKMVENKPTLRREVGMRFNDPWYDGFYARLEEQQIPLVSHVADPTECWDLARIPQWALAAGYYYGEGGYPSKEELTQEVLDVLHRFPRLKIIMAHFFFLSDDHDRICRLMEEHPNLCLDIVSGTEMYFNFSKDPEMWREFFIRYQGRIIYGTDNSNIEDPVEIENARITCRLQEHFLTGEGEIDAWDKKVRGIHLPQDVARKILGENFLRLTGPAHPLNHEAAARYLRNRLNHSHMCLTDEERALIQEVLSLM